MVNCKILLKKKPFLQLFLQLNLLKKKVEVIAIQTLSKIPLFQKSVINLYS